MAIETLPEPSIPITTPFRPRLGLSHGDADHRRRDDLPCAGDRLGRSWRPGLRRTIRCCWRRRNG